MKIRSYILTGSLIVSASLLTVSCGGGAATGEDPLKEENSQETEDTKKNALVNVDNKVYSVPSPFQLSLLIKESGVMYDADLLNDVNRIDEYTSNAQKALNLGVYGADLGYASIYQNSQDAFDYLGTVRKSAESLSLMEAFQESTLQRIEKNIENKDSLLILVANAYRECDSYLKDQDRHELAVLILAGGWAESVHFAVNAAKVSKNQKVLNRIGEQKNVLGNLVKMMEPHLTRKGVKEIYDKLGELEVVFSNVEVKYIYVKPDVDAVNKTTHLRSRAEVKLSDADFAEIDKKITELRQLITKG